MWRAINLRKLIVLVGSGVTVSLGHLSWNKILIEFIALSVAEFCGSISGKSDDNLKHQPFIRVPDHQRKLFSQIKQLCALESEEFYDLAVMDDPKEYVKELLLAQEAKNDLDRDALRTAVDLCEELLRVMDEVLPVAKHLPKVRTEFAKLFRSETEHTKENCIVDNLTMNPIDAILTYTRTKRVLTTNYDAEFERHLYSEWLASETQTRTHEQFERLSHFDPDGPNETRRNIVVKSPLRREIVSASMDASNVGDLVNFASFSRSEQYQIFHLHGRLDHPKEMVVTKRDYRRIYAQDPSSAEAFQAAQEILFTGNDVLMVGFGGEQELLLPFRRFVERGRVADQSPRRTFALMPSDTTKDYRRKNATKAIDWALDYDIYTIHYGGKRYRETMQALKTLKKRLIKIVEGKAEDNLPVFDPKAMEVIKANRTRKNPDDSRGEKALINEKRVKELVDHAQTESNFDRSSTEFKDWLGRAAKTLELTESETRGNAMIHELSELDRLSRDWWDAWRHAPYERRARYHVTSEEIAGTSGYLSVRHCSIWKPGLLTNEPASWPTLREARRLAELNLQKQNASSRRILRLSGTRGTGQATFANLLHHQQNQRYVFDLGENEFYSGAFLAHLSFSMEFSSVLKAFSRFFSYWIAKSLVNLPRQTSEAPASMTERNAVLLKTFEQQVKQAETLLTPHLSSVSHSLVEFERLRKLAKDLRLPPSLKAKIANHLRDPGCFATLDLPSDTRRQVAQELVAVSWEDDQSLMDIQLNNNYETSQLGVDDNVQRQHRLDMLRKAMADYSAVARGRRLFVCLSGLNRIADQNGDAFNPAHRALFRLLTDCEERTEVDVFLKEALVELPIDIVLIGGRPDVPIAYLSEEFSPEKNAAKNDTQEGADTKKLPDSGDFQRYSDRSATKRLLRRWGELPRLRWEDRIIMLGIKLEAKHTTNAEKKESEYQANPRSEDRKPGSLPDPQDAAAIFLRWANSTRSDFSHRDIMDLHESSQIHRLLWENLSLSLWVMRLWIFQSNEQKISGTSPVPYGFHSFLRDLDAAAARDGFSGVVQYVLDRYDYVDRRRSTAKVGHDAEENATYIPELYANIMRHLVLFALPVEPWVLLGCPLIQKVLRTEYKRRSDQAAIPFELSNDQLKNGEFRQAFLARLDWFERAFMLQQLQLALDDLVRRALVMKVQPAADAMQNTTTSQTVDLGVEVFLHQRYSLHNRMRQHIAHIIQLGVHDGADINHHRMSIYCDQPRELPAPTHEHFELVRDILEYQIDHCRETLWAVFQIGHERRRVADNMEGWDPEIEAVDPDDDDDTITESLGVNDDEDRTAAENAAARRIFSPEANASPCLVQMHDVLDKRARLLGLVNWDNPSGLGGSFGRLHAVPQRLRAMISLLQGSFAIGSLSRMTNIEPSVSVEAPTPFDAYRSWLRSLLNAGASLDRTQNEFERLFSGSTFQDNPTDKTAPSAWLANKPNDSASAINFRRIANVETRIRAASERLGLGPVQVTNHKSLRHPFYRDEIAWLYNERGLTALTQGYVYDALPLLKQAAFIMAHRRVPESDSHAFHAAERRIQLNYGIALLERGNVGDARRIFSDLQTSSLQIKNSTPSEIKPFSELYIAICDHVGGSFHRAEKSYEKLHGIFSDKNQFRAVAITCRSHADLCRVRKDYPAGMKLAELAIKAASRSEQRDVEHLGLVTLARLLISDGQHTEAMPLLDRSLNYARKMGLLRIEIDAKIAMSILMNNQGDYSLAGQFSSEAAARSVRAGLRLRKLGALLSYATSRRERGSIEFGNRLFSKIAREAEELGYMTTAGLANSELSQ